ncbi:DMT family transporter [Pelistega europaea]|uniref:DMT family transporter n=2 Tax=Pelistega europaea TaxID=106147 RepID=A0A7Y4LB06_9BURK|nr:DMT family transporter [Pelistega europaea]
MGNTVLKGIFFALSAAALNSSIGIFSKNLLDQNLNIQSIAFFKTIIALAIISLVLSRSSWQEQKNQIKPFVKNTMNLFLQIAFCAFLGIFTLFFFETTAYQYGHAANVVVVLMAAAAVSSLLGGAILLSESLKISAIVGTCLAVSGVFIISWSGSSQWLSILYAILAGSGYGLFSVLIKKFNLNGGMPLTRLLMMFGALYLFYPFITHFQHIEIQWNTTVILNLIALALLPTLIGFYCTTKALVYLSASKVQVTELSEPIFTMVLAWLLLNEAPNQTFFLGAFCIVLGIALINQILQLKKS